MSGGSWDYVYLKFEEVAAELARDDDGRRRALGELVGLIATALHDIEWVDSCDTAPGSEYTAIELALGLRTHTSVDALSAIREMRTAAANVVERIDALEEEMEDE